MVLPSVEIYSPELIGLDGTVTVVEIDKSASITATETVMWPPEIIIDGIDMIHSPDAYLQELAAPIDMSNVPYIGYRDHDTYTTTNATIRISNIKNVRELVEEENASVRLASATSNYATDWASANSLYFDLDIQNVDNLSLAVTVPAIDGLVQNSTVIHYDAYNSSTPADQSYLNIEFLDCKIKPRSFDDSTAPLLHSKHCEYNQCEFLRSELNEGTLSALSLTSHSGTGNVEVDTDSYTTPPDGFFLPTQEEAIAALIADAPEYADDAAAGVGGLTEGNVYVTTAGAVMRKQA